MAGSELKDTLIARWNAERGSRPTQAEMDLWPTTISELRMKLAIEADRSLKGDLYHRLAVALIKVEDYGSALEVAEEGLGQRIEGWKDLLLMDEAEALYLMGRDKEAFALVERMAPPGEQKTVEKIVPFVPKDAGTEVRLLCPECGGEVRYGSVACGQCGREIGEGFRVVRRPAVARNIEDHPIARSVHRDNNKEYHRTKEFSLLFTTWTVDYDDPQNFLTTHQHRMFGQETTTVTEKGWYTWVGAATLLFFHLAFGIILMASSSTGAPFAIMVIFWVVAILPITGLYLWVLLPPEDDGHSSS